MDTKAYLERIGYRGSTQASLSVLRKLHRRHLFSIPFENLDIHLHRPIILSETAFYKKIVQHRRGGFCYELNGSFAFLLKRLGFKVSMLSARVARRDGGFTADFDHMVLLVQLKHLWLADVGFGDSFTEPKRPDISSQQPDHGRDYRLIRQGGWMILSRRNEENGRWEPQYKFNLRPRKLSEFAPRCVWQQTSSKSHFKKGRVCTRLTSNGRLTLTDTKIVVTRSINKVERLLENAEEFTVLLRRYFGIELN